MARAHWATLAGAPLLLWFLGACLGEEIAPEPVGEVGSADAVDGIAIPVAMPLRTPTGAQARGLASQERELRSQGPWTGSSPMTYVLAGDREAARAASLAARATRRAFEGAPPVMPHSALFGDGSKECVDCHTNGMRLGERVAHPMSHPPLANCTQCHIESRHRDFPPPRPVESGFRGRAAPAPPPVGAGPPVIPHQVLMRGRCLSCHGEFGYPGLRTSHPERAACVQCHVATAPEPSFTSSD
ncbi:MAG: hypothetical protein GY711_09505 [bacterium]|nr:hypothetical protein [bacterium]